MMILLIPKGRIFYKFEKKIKNIVINKKPRKFLLKTNIKKLKLAIVKQEDILFYLKKIKNCIGILGYDYILNSKKINILINKKKIILKKSEFFNCNLCLIRKENDIKKRKNFIISTKYSYITKKIYNNIKKKKVIKINGSNELALKINISDYIVDIVDTGKTINENNLKVVYVLKKIFPIFVFFKNNNTKKAKNIIKKINEDIKL
ncbi:ATP phosphoribosyltransferase [Candidatus Vidania fulgoroideorum]